MPGRVCAQSGLVRLALESVFARCGVPALSAVFWYVLRHKDQRQRAARQAQAAATEGWGILSPPTFASVLSIGVLDGSVRNALLTFVPFLLMAKGVSEVSTSLMLTVIFAGGAVGKLGVAYWPISWAQRP